MTPTVTLYITTNIRPIGISGHGSILPTGCSKMQWIQKLLPIVMVSLMLIPASLTTAGEDDIELRSDTPTRTIFQETEANNQWSAANTIPVTTGSSIDIHGNLSGSSDLDHFYINLQGGSGSVDRVELRPKWVNASSSNDFFLAWFWGFTREEIDNSNRNEVSIAVDYWWPTSTFFSTISFEASYTGRYGLIIRPLEGLSGNLQYNFTLSITSVTPADNHNDRASARNLPPGNSLITESMVQTTDLFDWYHFSAPHNLYPTILDLSLSITAFNPDYSQTPFEFASEIDVFVFHNSRSSPGVFTKTEYRVASSSWSNFITDGAKASPYDFRLEKNCTEMYVAFMIRSFGVDSNGNRQYSLDRGTVTYNAGFNIRPNIPNKRPVMMDAKVEPMRGRSTDIFTFSVQYFDVQNDSAQQVELWLDGEFFKDLQQEPLNSYNYSRGVRYFVNVPGSQIGKDALHTFNISASDGRDWATGKENGTRTMSGPIVDDNLPPKSDVGDALLLNIIEDSEAVWLGLDDLFSDPNGNEMGFIYTILNEEGEWDERQYTDENLTVDIVNNGTLGEPDFRLRILPQPNVNGEFRIWLNASDGEFFEKFTELELIIMISPVNDDPMIKMIGASLIQEWDLSFSYDIEQGEMFEISVRAEDMDGDALEYQWDIGEVLKNPKEGVNYGYNSSNGDLWFITGDADVPSFQTMISIDDGKGGSDSFILEFYVDNVNDPPRITVPAERSTIQGEYLYIIPSFIDPDIDSGDIITFSYNLGDLSSRTPASAIDFTQSNGRLEILVMAEEMIGEWEINITVVDLDGLADWGVCKVTIGNVNDPPQVYDINLEQQSNNLTVIFHTGEATDPDHGDVLTYIWDFGDGSDIVSGVEQRDVSHTFPGEGAYTVVLKVWDGLTYSEPKELIVTVTAPLPDPDMDEDGMKDEWELRFGLDPTSAEDALMDPDEDGLTNLEEYEYYEETGRYLNPWDPDTDRDGWKDGEELERSYDPLDPSVHPEDPNKDINLLLWIAAFLFVLLGVAAVLMFIVTRSRNKKDSVAMPVAASPIPAPLEQLPEASTGQIEQGVMPELPPAGMDPYYSEGQDQYYQEPQYMDDGIPVEQAPDNLDPGYVPQDHPPADQQYQAPVYGTEPVYDTPVVDTVAAPPDIQDQQQMIEQAEIPLSPDPEVISDGQVDVQGKEQASADAAAAEGADEGLAADKKVDEEKESSSSLPPLPELPDI